VLWNGYLRLTTRRGSEPLNQLKRTNFLAAFSARAGNLYASPCDFERLSGQTEQRGSFGNIDHSGCSILHRVPRGIRYCLPGFVE